VAVTKRRRGAKPEVADDAAPATTAATRRARRTASKTTLSEPDLAPIGDVTSDGASGAIPDPSANGPSDVATGPVPDPGAEPPSEAALETSTESAPDTAPSGERVDD
jgi:hypothetical protein